MNTLNSDGFAEYSQGAGTINNPTEEKSFDNNETERKIVEESFVPREKFSEKALKIIDQIETVHKSKWEAAKENSSLEKAPSLAESIKSVLEETVAEQFPGSKYDRDDGFLSLGGFEWVTKEMALEEYKRLADLKEKGINVENNLHQISDWIKSGLDSARTTLADSSYLSHASISTDRILNMGALASREITGVQASTHSSAKDEDQEASEVPLNISTVAMRYGARGLMEGMRGAFFLPSLPVLLREDISFFSADGLHVFAEAGTAFNTQEAILVTTKTDFDNGMNGITKKNWAGFGQSQRPDTHKEILTEEGKSNLQNSVLKDESGNPVFIKPDDFERPMSQMPEDVLRLVEDKLQEKNAVDKEQIRSKAYLLPTGEFGDGPGQGTKLFKRRVVLNG